MAVRSGSKGAGSAFICLTSQGVRCSLRQMQTQLPESRIRRVSTASRRHYVRPRVKLHGHRSIVKEWVACVQFLLGIQLFLAGIALQKIKGIRCLPPTTVQSKAAASAAAHSSFANLTKQLPGARAAFVRSRAPSRRPVWTRCQSGWPGRSSALGAAQREASS